MEVQIIVTLTLPFQHSFTDLLNQNGTVIDYTN